jgi:LPXTG-site transpeptidase (sortase) family protein
MLDGLDGVMGVMTIPSIGVNLPIYHTTGLDVLEHGVGHLPGSALPVGGPGTHAVLTAHSGVIGDRLFTDLPKVRLGDLFYLRVLGETLTYEVDDIQTVLPTDLAALGQVPGADYVTLVTCTPLGINSHRLLVRGTRVPTPVDGTAEAAVTAAVAAPGAPWWPYPAPGAALLLVLVTRPRRAAARGPAHPPRQEHPAARRPADFRPHQALPTAPQTTDRFATDRLTADGFSATRAMRRLAAAVCYLAAGAAVAVAVYLVVALPSGLLARTGAYRNPFTGGQWTIDHPARLVAIVIAAAIGAVIAGRALTPRRR